MVAISTQPLGLLAVFALAATVGAVAAAYRAHVRARQAERTLERASQHDLLTDLPNHARARAELAAILDRHRGGILLLELDRFATVNESYGHEIGDRLLRSLAEQLERLVQDGEVLARWGGPQFALVVDAATSPEALTRRGAELQEAITAKVRVGHDTLWVTATIGAVALDDRFGDVDAVVEAARTALALARHEGRGGRCTYDRTMASPVATSGAADRIAEAMAADELWVLYEPLVSMADRRLVGVEAHLHWADPQRGLVGPDDLADVLERSGLADGVAEHAVGLVVRQAGVWHREHPSLTVTVSVPPSLLTAEGFPERLADLVAESGAHPSELCLQVSGENRNDLYALWSPLRTISALGVQIALDQFGTGWSSLSFLRRFSLDVLKVPSALTSTITSSHSDAAVAQQVVGLANALGLVPIAEGITSQAQADLLTSLGCELGQGPWFGRPMPLAGIEPVLERGRVDPAGRASSGIDWTAPAG